MPATLTPPKFLLLSLLLIPRQVRGRSCVGRHCLARAIPHGFLRARRRALDELPQQENGKVESLAEPSRAEPTRGLVGQPTTRQRGRSAGRESTRSAHRSAATKSRQAEPSRAEPSRAKPSERAHHHPRHMHTSDQPHLAAQQTPIILSKTEKKLNVKNVLTSWWNAEQPTNEARRPVSQPAASLPCLPRVSAVRVPS